MRTGRRRRGNGGDEKREGWDGKRWKLEAEGGVCVTGRAGIGETRDVERRTWPGHGGRTQNGGEHERLEEALNSTLKM